ncbi:phage tail component protein [Dictyocaulus viviparus]|uniref:Non-structural maintenance of chromosomes element 4 n=1 Tax=Dictyocaulus viviparus TaxID=29172 RepID=A0A0D8XBZ0_DICVI|nr:phage tail component protein [Dictyocaulus viviparus]
MPRPLGNNNGIKQSENEGGDVVEENGLTKRQIQEANYLNSLVVEAEPSQYFAERALLRETYQNICSQFQEGLEVDRNDNKHVIENLGNALENVERSYKNIGAGGKELAADADTLLSMAKILMTQMQSFQNANAERVVTTEGFAKALILHMASRPQNKSPSLSGDDNILLIEEEELDGTNALTGPKEPQGYLEQPALSSNLPKVTIEQWAWFSRQNCGTLTYDVSFNYQSLRSVSFFDDVAACSATSKKERVKRKKEVLDPAVVLTKKEFGCIDDEVSVAQELDKVRKKLKQAWKNNPSVDFYSFVVDPEDFGKSVENMFYVSFLVKDGRVRLSFGDDGLPVLLHVSNEERQKLNVDDRSAALTNQAIVPFSYEMWEKVVETMGLRA